MKSTALFKLSLLGNAALAAVVCLLMLRRSETRPVDGGEPPTANVTAPAPEPFNWSQLESTEYPVYIANLRGIGCPERTIREIITTDVDGSLYAARRAKILEREQLLAANHGQTLTPEFQDLEVERHRQWQEEIALLAKLLGLTPPPAESIAAAPVNAAAKPPPSISMPLVFAGSAADLNLNPTQAKVFNGLQEGFIEDLGGTNADSGSPEYAERWRHAQPEIDRSVKTLLGYQVYRQLELQAPGRASGN